MASTTAKLLTIFTGGALSNSETNSNNNNNNGSLILKAPQQNEIKFFNETGILQLDNNNTSNDILFYSNQTTSNINKKQTTNINKIKKKVTFPEDDKIIKDYSDPPKNGWIPGTFSTVDLLEAYLKSCDRHKCKPLNKLIPHLKALQDLDCANGEKVNVLNLKSERLDSKQMEALEEIFKRLSFKTIDLESSYFDDDSTGATLFEILQYYDTCERLILANNRSISLFGWQELSKFIRKSSSIEYLDLKGHTFPELIYFTYIARSFKLTQTLRVIHLEFSNISQRYLLMLAAALKDNEQIKEVYLSDNKLQSTDGSSIATLIKENNYLELIDLKNNNLQDIGLSHICSGLSEKTTQNVGLKTLIISNNNITANGVSYLSKALIHNRSLTSLNISQNLLANEAVYELKEALIVNKQISGLYLCKTKLTDEGTIALAEYIAETQSLNRLDLRENDIRLGGLMALASSLKFNKTLYRLDLDRDPKRENSIKDSIETSKRLIQDINEYCLRNKRLDTEREIALKEQTQREKEERLKIQIENEKQLIELVNESSQGEQQQQASQKIEQEEEEEVDIVDLIEEDEDKLLKKILNRNLNSQPGLFSPMSSMISDDLINYLNIDKLNRSENHNDSDINTNTESEYQLVEETINEQLITNDNHVDRMQNSDLINDIEKYSIDTDVLAIAKQLVEDVIKNTQKIKNTHIDEDDSIIMNDSVLSNFNDSNDLSQSIERETLFNDDDPEASNNNKINKIEINCVDTSTISNSINEEEDSDIEVLTVSSKSSINKELVKNIAVLKLEVENSSSQTEKNSTKLKTAALLSSITEQDAVECLNNNSSSITIKYQDSIKEEIENSENAIMSNYDLITDHVSQPWVEPFVNNSTKLNDLAGDQTTPPPTPTLILNNDLASSSSTSLNINDSITKSDLLLLSESNKINFDSSSKLNNNNEDEEKEEDNLLTDDLIQKETNANIILNDLNNKPFFNSQLTNSQMSECISCELSHEIGLLCE